MPHASADTLPMPFRLDHGVAPRAAVGLVALATDQSVEHEWRRLLDLEGVAFFVSRIPSAAATTPATLRDLEGHLTAGAAQILPGVPLDVLALACTSGAALIGEEAVARRLRQGHPQVRRTTTPLTAAKAAFRALGLRRIALLTSYIEPINQALRRHLEAAGMEIGVLGSFHVEDDTVTPRIAPEAIRAAVLELAARTPVDGVFVSCTNLRAAGLVAELEARLDVPVTASNHAMAWHALRLAGVGEALADRGRLFQAALAED